MRVTGPLCISANLVKNRYLGYYTGIWFFRLRKIIPGGHDIRFSHMFEISFAVPRKPGLSRQLSVYLLFLIAAGMKREGVVIGFQGFYNTRRRDKL